MYLANSTAKFSSVSKISTFFFSCLPFSVAMLLTSDNFLRLLVNLSIDEIDSDAVEGAEQVRFLGKGGERGSDRDGRLVGSEEKRI